MKISYKEIGSNLKEILFEKFTEIVATLFLVVAILFQIVR